MPGTVFCRQYTSILPDMQNARFYLDKPICFFYDDEKSDQKM